jgi:heptosyltransferase-2
MIVPPERLLVIAPNWLGDAVMALPLIADIHREWPEAHLTVAGRGSVAALFEMVDEVDDVIALEGRGGVGAIAAAKRNTRTLAAGAFDVALLLPNSFLSAWIAARAGIPERWGYRADWRGRLLTRALPRPRRPVHQAEYYQTIAAELGLVPGPRYAHITVSEKGRRRAEVLLAAAGIEGDRTFVAMAPGAAYGRAKQWLPERFAELATFLANERQIRTVLVGARADSSVCRDIASRAGGAVDLSGRTDLPSLAGVLARAHAVVANDSGAMHLAAATGTHVVAIFGPTNEKKTAPLDAAPERKPAAIVATDVWCRPCMLRECPIDHRCMTGISARAVFEHIRVRRSFSGGE